MRPATESDRTFPASTERIPIGSTSTRQRLAYGIVTAVCASMLAASLATAGPAAAVGAESPHTAAAAASSKVATLSIFEPDHLLQSTGNLYWTYNVGSTGGRHHARLYSMSKAGPAGTAVLRYQESGTDLVYFRALAYAKIGTQWYAYFVVDNARPRTSVIKRVNLAGGSAVTIVASPRYISSRGLVTDGQFLFWADEGGLRRSTIGEAGLTTLARGASLGSVRATALCCTPTARSGSLAGAARQCRSIAASRGARIPSPT